MTFPMPNSAGTLRPGDILQDKYIGFGLVVLSNRRVDGTAHVTFTDGTEMYLNPKLTVWIVRTGL